MHHYRAFTQFAALLSPIEAERKRNAWTMASTVDSCNCKKRLEARVGIEPTYKGFADLFSVALSGFALNNSLSAHSTLGQIRANSASIARVCARGKGKRGSFC